MNLPIFSIEKRMCCYSRYILQKALFYSHLYRASLSILPSQESPSLSIPLYKEGGSLSSVQRKECLCFLFTRQKDSNSSLSRRDSQSLYPHYIVESPSLSLYIYIEESHSLYPLYRDGTSLSFLSGIFVQRRGLPTFFIQKRLALCSLQIGEGFSLVLSTSKTNPLYPLYRKGGSLYLAPQQRKGVSLSVFSIQTGRRGGIAMRPGKEMRGGKTMRGRKAMRGGKNNARRKSNAQRKSNARKNIAERLCFSRQSRVSHYSVLYR